ncbi:MAG TPA: ankyrin repeat domain-containing protein, partial [Campylobacterales bacterium]|nr:ankyrin repeat domain-containing protein [Campylobacterales bacterium]
MKSIFIKTVLMCMAVSSFAIEDIFSELLQASRLNGFERALLLAQKNERDRKEILCTPLHSAVFLDDVEKAKLLIKNGVDIDLLGTQSSTPLYYATVLKNAKMVKFLLDNGADVRNKNIDLLSMATMINSTDIVRLLLNNGATIKSKFDYMPLENAARNNNIEMLDLLLDSGFDINEKNERWGDTALHVASHEGRLDAVKLLIKRGAKVDAKS